MADVLVTIGSTKMMHDVLGNGYRRLSYELDKQLWFPTKSEAVEDASAESSCERGSKSNST